MKRITAKRAKELNQNFVATRSEAIEEAIGKKDALSTWFSIDELKNFIKDVEEEGKAQKITVNGIRVYFGAYSEEDKIEEKRDLSTVFLVPTQPYKNSKEKEGDEGGNDIEELGGFNEGGMGWPPGTEYPQ